MTSMNIPPVMATWTAPAWATETDVDEEVIVYTHLVGTLPSSPDSETIKVVIIQRDDLTSQDGSCTVSRTSAAVLVAGVRIAHRDIPKVMEMLQMAADCVA